MTGMGMRADLYTAAGAKVANGGLDELLSATYTLGLGKIGAFAISLPAESERASVVAQGQEVKLYREGEGLVFRGIVDKLETQVDANGASVLVVSGSSIARQLVWANTLLGLQFNSTTLSSSLSTLLSGTGWAAGTLASPPTTAVARMDGATVWDGCQRLADLFGLYLREDNISREVDIAAFGTNPNGLVFQNVEVVTPELAENPKLVPIASFRVIGESQEVWNKIVPLGQQQGLQGVDLNLANSNRSTPYTRQSATGPDGKTYYYLEDAASVTAFGRRTKVVRFKEIVPLGLSATDFQRAANALYDNAATWLTRRKDAVESYEVVVTGFKHIVGGAPVVQVGDVVRVVFRGITQDASGARAWKSVDANLYVMEMTRAFAKDGSDAWRFVLNTVARELVDDGNVTAQMMDQIQAVESAPSPFVLFADGDMRIDQRGIQSKNNTAKWFFAPAFSDIPGTVKPYGSFEGNAAAAGSVLRMMLNQSDSLRLDNLWNANPGAAANTAMWYIFTGFTSATLGAISAKLSVVTDDTDGAYVRIEGGPLWLQDLGTGAPSLLRDGMLWYNNLDKLQARINGVTVDLGAGMNKVTGSGYLTTPGASLPNVTPALANSAWVQVVASTTEADSLIGIGYRTATAGQMDIGVGSAGAEVAVSTILLPTTYPTGGSPIETTVMLPATIEIPAGSRISVRTRVGSTSASVSLSGIMYVKASELVGR